MRRIEALTRRTPEHLNLDHDRKEGYRDGYHKRWSPKASRNRSLVYHEAAKLGRDAREGNKAR